MGNRSFLLIVAALFAGVVVFVLRPSQEEQRPSLVDREYCFQIDDPGHRWQLLPEAEIQKIVPDALAGAVTKGGLYCVVVGEMAPDVEIKAFAKMVRDNMSIEGLEVARLEDIEFKGRPAIRTVITGLFNEIPVTYDNVIFRNGDYVFQVLGYGPRRRVEADSFEPFRAAFKILAGEPTSRRTRKETVDTGGIGWRLRGGRFESAALRLAVEPQGGWRVAVGAELYEMGPAAEVGLVHASPEAYMTVIAEVARDVDPEAFEQHLRAQWVANMGVEAQGAALSLQSADRRTLSMQPFRSQQGPPLRFLYGVHREGHFWYQVLIWHYAGLADALAPALSEAVGSLRFLDSDGAWALRAKLRGAVDPQNRVGANFCQRRGRYRDYEYAFMFEKPADTFWRVRAGAEARAENEEATLYFDEPSLGVTGLLIAESADEWENDRYHAAVAGALFAPAPDGKPEQLLVGGVAALSTEAPYQTPDGVDLSYRIVSLLHGNHAYQWSFYGVPGNMKAASEEIAAFLAGVSFPRNLVAQRAESGRFVDDRLGYAFQPPEEGWTRKDTTPRGIEALASGTTWTRGTRQILVLAICALQPAQDEAWFHGYVEKMMSRHVGGAFAKEPERSLTRIGGQAGSRLTWKSRRRETSVYLTVRDRTFYAFLVENRRGAIDGERLKVGFQLLD